VGTVGFGGLRRCRCWDFVVDVVVVVVVVVVIIVGG
jgi:hypothetical protein